MTAKPALTIRDAAPDDAADLAAFAVMAAHGMMELYYEGLLPGRSTLATVIDRRILWPNGFNHWSRWKVVCDGGRVIGGLNAFPHADFDAAPADPLLDGWRMDLTRGLWDLEKWARGTYYLNMIAAHPEARGRGAGHLLMADCLRQARAAGHTRITLSTFEEDTGLMAFYGRHGFQAVDRAPIPAHPAMHHGGNWVLLARTL